MPKKPKRSGIHLYSSNGDKLKEFQSILNIPVSLAPTAKNETNLRELIDIQSISIVEVVEEKARQAYENLGNKPAIVEHTGLYIKNLANLPGPMSGPFFKTLKLGSVCRLAQGSAAEAKTLVAFFNGFHVFYFCGTIKGRIARRPRGKAGFGWDSIFIPEKESRTFAELSLEEKNAYSMRAIAIRRMKEFFDFEEGLIQALRAKRLSGSHKFFTSFLNYLGSNAGNKKSLLEHKPPFYLKRIPRKQGLSADRVSQLMNLSNSPEMEGMEFHNPSLDRLSKRDLGNSIVAKCNILPRLNSKQLEELDNKLSELELFQYASYGDSLTKNFRQSIIEALGLQREDCFYLQRSSNCKIIDSLLGLATSEGQALYYNTRAVTSGIEYSYQAFKRNQESGNSHNLFFRQNIAADVTSILVYGKNTLDTFSKKNGQFFVPMISLAETVGYFIYQRRRNKGKIREYFENSDLQQEEIDAILKSWAVSAFSKFPEKRKDHIPRQLDVMEFLLSKGEIGFPREAIQSPRSFKESLDVVRAYRDVLINQSRNPDTLLRRLRKALPGNSEIFFTEMAVLRPGLKSRINEISNTPDPDIAFIQGTLEGKSRNPSRDVEMGHTLCSRLMERKSTKVVTLVTKDGIPLVNPASRRSTPGSKAILRESIPFRFLTLLLLPNVSEKTKLDAIHLWNTTLTN